MAAEPAEEALALCEARRDWLTAWQRGFTAALSLQSPQQISPRQAEILERIAERCRRG